MYFNAYVFVEVREQFVGVGSLSTMRSWRSNLAQAWWQAPLFAELSHCPKYSLTRADFFKDAFCYVPHFKKMLLG